jgi:hypothetical protein
MLTVVNPHSPDCIQVEKQIDGIRQKPKIILIKRMKKGGDRFAVEKLVETTITH